MLKKFVNSDKKKAPYELIIFISFKWFKFYFRKLIGKRMIDTLDKEKDLTPPDL